MKDYKRLTKWGMNKFSQKPEADLKDKHSEPIVAITRLAELEDKIEAGTLVEVPKGAVVLTPEERAEKMRLCNEERKQAVKEFADEFKRRYFFMMTTYMKDPIYQCTGDELDRFVKEVCGE